MARRFITAEDVAGLAAGAQIEVDEATTVTSSARELARRRGVQIVPVPGEQALPAAGSGADPGEHAVEPTSAATGGAPAGTILVTAVGVNRPGVMAELTGAVGQLGGDIQDVSQRITGGYFNTTLVVDIARSSHSFVAFRDALCGLTEQSDYVVTVIDERVFRAMHRL